jgi:hypothetical protein
MNLFDFHFDMTHQNSAPCDNSMGVLCPLKINVIQTKAVLSDLQHYFMWCWITTKQTHQQGGHYGNTKDTQQTAERTEEPDQGQV